MCGVAGIRQYTSRTVNPEALSAMAATLLHRGPDDSGFWSDGPYGVAHTRLSIIDLAGSRQPMVSADERWVLVFNGEIFNYRELRAGLDYPFSTDGDTEVILAGIATKGLNFVEKLVGQFAFALIDRSTGSVHLVRDRLGVLPLYYELSSTALVFASEVKAIIAGRRSTPSVDLASLDAYLTGRSVPAPETLFAGISKLPPAHRAEIDSDGRLTLTRYWEPPVADSPSLWTPATAVDAVDEAVTTAVASALVADVPVGAYLSGGIDSSLIVAKIKALSGEPVQTFAAGFGDPRHDELPWARRVSEHIGTEHHEVLVDASGFDDLWAQLSWHRDAPVSQPADIAVFRLAEEARRHVRVVLSGEGGDELFAGYPKYRAARAIAAASRLPAGMRASLAGGIEHRLPERLGRARIALRVLGEREPGDQFRAWFSPFTIAERARLLAGVPQHSYSTPGQPDGDVIRAMLLADLWNWLPDNLLERGDRMSMAASLELRPPLLDHRLVELAFRLPSSVKVNGGRTKWVLKEVARRHLPDDVVDRRKVGFHVPLDAWFRGGLRESMWDRLTGAGSFIAETFDQRAVRDLLERHESGRYNEESRLFTLMSLEVWHETFFRTERAVVS